MKTDDRKIQPIVGSQDLAVALGGSADRHPRRSHGKCVKKFPSSYHLLLLSLEDQLLLIRPRSILMGTVLDPYGAPASSRACFMPAQLMRVDASGVAASCQCVSRLTAS